MVWLKYKKELWHLDSRCLRHMSSNASLFIGIRKKRHKSVTYGDKDMGNIISIGEIGKDPTNSIDNVCLIDGLKLNLLSISQLCDNGNLVAFDSTHCMLKSRKYRKVTLYGPRIGNVYEIDINDIPSSNLVCSKVSHHDDGYGIKY